MTTRERDEGTITAVVPHLAVPDVARAAEYYRDVLGFEIVGFWDGEDIHHDPTRPAVFGIVRRDNTRIHFNRGESSRLASGLAEGAYDLYFDVSNVQAVAKSFAVAAFPHSGLRRKRLLNQ
jgi:catechol 2,3-dioxygenase-like lactoylglutathione lyase family enzyme